VNDWLVDSLFSCWIPYAAARQLWGVYTIQQTFSKRPAIRVYFEYICWKFAGRLLDRVNTLLAYA